jgi:membrane-bound lytic murein transglycosylase F
MGKNISRLIGLTLLWVVPWVVLSCDQPVFRDDLEAIKARGELKVITRNNATCYYEGPHGPVGFEYDLARAFAEHLGVKLKLVILDTYQEMVSTLLSGDADLIAAGLTASDHQEQHLYFGPGYLEVYRQVVGRRDGPDPKNVKDLSGQLLCVSAGTSHEHFLLKLKQQYPELLWKAIPGYETEQLLELAWQGSVPLTVAYSDIIDINLRYYPELMVHFNLGKGQKLAWAMHPQNRRLQAAVYTWFNQESTTALLKRLKQHYYKYLEVFDYVDLMRFRRRLTYRLPRYQKYFEEAGKKHGIDWKLVAAQSYQESHWNPRAKSFTGVRGIMMLTLETARHFKVESRLDPKQSIYAGTRYLARLHSRLGDEVPEPDRTYMALAAYNVGWGHLEDARTLALRLGKAPNTWHDVRSTLPLLRQKKYYKTLEYGYARGTEPVRYVECIRTYYKILMQNMERAHRDNEKEAKPSDGKPSGTEKPGSS